jgi:CheY-like chemotaxis protein
MRPRAASFGTATVPALRLLSAIHADSPAPLIVVVDDDPVIREVLSELLRMEGYLAITFGFAADALAALRGGLRPDLILLDLRMPDMNGWDFRRLQLADPELAGIPVVIATGANERPLEHVITTAAGVLRKPLDADTLLSTVARLVPRVWPARE